MEKCHEQNRRLMDDSSDCEDVFLREDTRIRFGDKPRCNRSTLILSLLLLLSISANTYTCFKSIFAAQTPPSSTYAHLELNRETVYETPEAEERTNWKPTNPDPGAVALHDDEVQALGLLIAQRFPWDEEKGLYFISAFHSLHCIKTLHQMIREYEAGVSQSHGSRHALHCLESLEDDIKCFADDTPRVSTWEYPGNTGMNQRRVCRDWDKLERWAVDRSSCYQYVAPGQDIEALLRYRYCPEGSPYRAKVEEIFGADWEASDNLTVEYPLGGLALAGTSY